MSVADNCTERSYVGSNILVVSLLKHEAYEFTQTFVYGLDLMWGGVITTLLGEIINNESRDLIYADWCLSHICKIN